MSHLRVSWRHCASCCNEVISNPIPSYTKKAECIPLKLLDYASLILKAIDAIDNRLRFGINVGVRRRGFRNRDVGRNLVLGTLLLRGLGLGLCREVVVDSGRHGERCQSVEKCRVQPCDVDEWVLGQPGVRLGVLWNRRAVEKMRILELSKKKKSKAEDKVRSDVCDREKKSMEAVGCCPVCLSVLGGSLPCTSTFSLNSLTLTAYDLQIIITLSRHKLSNLCVNCLYNSNTLHVRNGRTHLEYTTHSRTNKPLSQYETTAPRQKSKSSTPNTMPSQQFPIVIYPSKRPTR